MIEILPNETYLKFLCFPESGPGPLKDRTERGLSYSVGLSSEKNLARPGFAVSTTNPGCSTGCSTGVENLIANGEAFEGRGFRLIEDVDAVDKPRGRPVTLEMEVILDLFCKGSWPCDGRLTGELEGISDEA